MRLIYFLFLALFFNCLVAQETKFELDDIQIESMGQNYVVIGYKDKQIKIYVLNPQMKEVKAASYPVKKHNYSLLFDADKGKVLINQRDPSSNSGVAYFIAADGSSVEECIYEDENGKKKFIDKYNIRMPGGVTFKEFKGNVKNHFCAVPQRIDGGKILVAALTTGENRPAAMPQDWSNYVSELMLIVPETNTPVFKQQVVLKDENLRPFPSRIHYDAASGKIYVAGNYFDLTKVGEQLKDCHWDIMHGFFINVYDMSGKLLNTYHESMELQKPTGFLFSKKTHQFMLINAIKILPDGRVKVLGENMIVHAKWTTDKNSINETTTIQQLYSTFGFTLYELDKNLTSSKKIFDDVQAYLLGALVPAKIESSSGNFAYKKGDALQIFANTEIKNNWNAFQVCSNELDYFIYESEHRYFIVSVKDGKFSHKVIENVKSHDGLLNTYKPRFFNDPSSNKYILCDTDKKGVSFFISDFK